MRWSWTMSLLLAWAAAHAGEPVKVALLAPMSGPFANVGDLYFKHALLALEGVNRTGGVLGGRELELVAYDDKNSPQEALLMLRRITDARIPFVISVASHVANPLAEAVERHNAREPDNRLLHFSEPGNQDLTNEKCSFWSFAFMSNPEVKMEALTSHLARQGNVRRVYLINQDFLFGHQVRKFARESLLRKRPDITIVGDDLHPLGKLKDFSAYVSKIAAARADAVITGNWGNDMALLVKAAASAGLNVDFYTFYGMGPGAPTAMGTAAERVKVVWRWHPNLAVEEERKTAEEYERRFRMQYYSMPLNNLFEMLASALERTGTTSAAAVASALEDITVTTPMGEAWMRASDHQLFEPLYIIGLVRADGREVKYDLERSGVGTRTEARIESKDLLLPTRCRMQRPSSP